MKNKKEINPIDLHVAKKIKLARKIKGYTLKDLADKMEVSYQQCQKYESGENRITSGKLYDVASILGTSIDYYFYGHDFSYQEEIFDKYGVDFLKAISKVKNPKVRKRIIELIDSFTEN